MWPEINLQEAQQLNLQVLGKKEKRNCSESYLLNDIIMRGITQPFINQYLGFPFSIFFRN